MLKDAHCSKQMDANWELGVAYADKIQRSRISAGGNLDHIEITVE